MYDFFAQKKAQRSFPRFRLDADSIPAFSMLLLLVGVALGALIGTYAENPISPDKIPVGDAAVPDSVAASAWNYAKYLFFLLLSATSYLGLLTIPAILLLRGYALSCAVAAMFASASYRGLLCAFLICGVPAMLTVPPLMILALDCFARSRHLLRQRFGKFFYPMRDIAFLRHCFAAFLLTAVAAFYSGYILPYLLALL